jgi:type I restriction enzyme, S subunit
MTIYRFDQIAENLTVRVEPGDTDLERYVGLEHLDPESLKLRRWGSPSHVIGQKLRFWKGDIIYGKRRAYQRKLVVADFEGICSAHAMVLRAKPDICLPELLPFFMQSEAFHQRALKISVGSLSPTINWSALARQEFPLPPLDEQRRIANLLWAANNSISSYQDVFDYSVKLKKAYLAHIFQKGINHVIFKDTLLGKLPESWRVLSVGDVCEFLDNLRVPLSSSERAKRKGVYPYYGASGIIDHIDGYLFDESLILLGEDGANIIDRSTPLAFKVAGKIWVNNHAHVLRVKKEFEMDYIVEYLESISYAKYKTGTAQPKLNKENISGIPLPIPPQDEQQIIVKNIHALNDTRVSLMDHIDKLKKLKTSILLELFSG